MSTLTFDKPSPELQLALAAVLAGHHDARQTGRERAVHATARLTMALALVAGLVMSYNVLLLVV